MRETEIVDLWAYEYAAFSDGYKLVCGIDEAGRGPLAGPVCAAAVILPPDCRIEGLNDSKKLTDKRRCELYDVIVENAVAYGIAFASHQEIDEINILQATFLAMRRAVEQLVVQPELALGGDLDGCDVLPDGMHGLRDYALLETNFENWGFGEQIVRNLFYQSLEKVVKLCIM